MPSNWLNPKRKPFSTVLRNCLADMFQLAAHCLQKSEAPLIHPSQISLNGKGNVVIEAATANTLFREFCEVIVNLDSHTGGATNMQLWNLQKNLPATHYHTTPLEVDRKIFDSMISLAKNLQSDPTLLTSELMSTETIQSESQRFLQRFGNTVSMSSQKKSELPAPTEALHNIIR